MPLLKLNIHENDKFLYCYLPSFFYSRFEQIVLPKIVLPTNCMVYELYATVFYTVTYKTLLKIGDFN